MEDLSLIITDKAKFIGIFINTEETYILQEAVSVIEVMTERGMAIVSTIIGTVNLNGIDYIKCTLSTKSPYYQNYYQTVSNVQLAPANIQSLRNN